MCVFLVDWFWGVSQNEICMTKKMYFLNAREAKGVRSVFLRHVCAYGYFRFLQQDMFMYDAFPTKVSMRYVYVGNARRSYA